MFQLNDKIQLPMRTLVRINFGIQAFLVTIAIILTASLLFSRIAVLFLLYGLFLVGIIQPISALLMYFMRAPLRSWAKTYLIGVLIWLGLLLVLRLVLNLPYGEAVLDAYVLFVPLPLTVFYWIYSYRAFQTLKS